MSTAGRFTTVSIDLAIRIIEYFNQSDGDLTKEDSIAAPSEALDLADDLMDKLVGSFFDTLEDDVLAPLTDGDLLTPDNVEQRVDQSEGAAIQNAIRALALNIGIEATGLTQLETHQQMITQVTSFLALEDILGARSQLAFEKGVQPALEARVAKQTQSEFVALPDAIEFALRKREGDRGWLGGSNTPSVVQDAVGSNDPVRPDNILEEWGIRPDQRQILEEVSLEAVEAEELLESPIQFGVVPDAGLVERNARRAGLPESVIDLFVETAEAAVRSADLWEQKTTTGDLVGELDTAVDDGEISVDQAVRLLPEEIDDAKPALRDRWEAFTTTPNKSPTRSQFEGSFAWGLTDLDVLTDRLDRTDIDPEKYSDVVDAGILDELDGDLRTAVGLGILSENEYSQYAARVGLDQDAINSLLGGTDLDDYAKSVLKDDSDATGFSVGNIIDIGPSREAALRSAGVATVGDLASADASEVSETLAISPEFSRTLIDRADRRVN
jgi:hypothetical protein